MAVKGTIKPLRDYVMVADMNFDEVRLQSGIILRKDDGKSHGIRPRWARVYAVGSEQKDVKVGQWILIEHGRWTRGIKVEESDGSETVVRRVDNDCIMMVSDEQPVEEYWSKYDD